MSSSFEALLTPTRRAYFVRLARAHGVPEPFVEDAVQDIIVGIWRNCPGGRGWFKQASWSASSAAERYGYYNRKRSDRPRHQVRPFPRELVLDVDEHHPVLPKTYYDPLDWGVLDTILDVRSAIAKLPLHMQHALHRTVYGTPKPNDKSYVYRARRQLALLLRAEGIADADCET